VTTLGGRFGAVITAGGRSSRIGPIGEVIPKGLLPLVAPRLDGTTETAIGRIVAGLREAGVTDIVVAATDHWWFDLAAEAYGVAKVVVPPTGEYDAVRAGWRALPPCTLGAVISSDNVFPGRGLQEFLAAPDPHLPLVAAAYKPAIRRYTEVTLAGPRPGSRARPGVPAKVEGLVEKPDRDGGGLAKAGAYRFPGPVLDALVAGGIRQDRFGERSMTEALLRVMADGPVLTVDLAGSFLDIGTPAGLDESIRVLAGEQGRAPALAEAPS
jgi:dTDP-glucose pyrophosphorylase